MSTTYLASIHHDGSQRYVHAYNGADLRLGDEVSIRLRAATHAPIERILLRTCPDGAVFQELFTGQMSTISNGNLPIPALPAGVQIWKTVP